MTKASIVATANILINHLTRRLGLFACDLKLASDILASALAPGHPCDASNQRERDRNE